MQDFIDAHDQAYWSARLSKFIQKQPGGCWLWIGCKNQFGYGEIFLRANNTGKRFRTHRLLYTMHKGAIPKDMDVLHTCDTPSCCNPEHLFVGSHADNMRDMAKKQRGTLGERQRKSKLKAADVLIIRQLRGIVTQHELARRFGVGHSIIGSIQLRTKWRHI